MLALLHTSPVHVPVFDALRDRQRPGLTLRHTVAPELLDRARREGPGTVADEIAEVVRRAADEGAGAVLCTCSTLGAVAETVPAAVPVLRIDRPMAEAAVARAGDGRITVAAALASTLGPTADLVTEAARRAGHRPRITTLLVPGAWDLFEWRHRRLPPGRGRRPHPAHRGRRRGARPGVHGTGPRPAPRRTAGLRQPRPRVRGRRAGRHR